MISPDERAAAPDEGSAPKRRLLGLETEYALRFSPSVEGGAHPGNRRIYEALKLALEGLVKTLPSSTQQERLKFFTANGGAFCYEHLPTSPDGGLIEGATPECSSPQELLLYQKAQDRLLERAIPEARWILRRQGFDGSLGILKNCRDAEGHVYGAQENYEARLARGWRLWALRGVMGATAPLLVVPVVLTWAVLLVALVVLLLVVLPWASVRAAQAGRRDADEVERALYRFSAPLSLGVHYVLWAPFLMPFLWALRAWAFVPQRRAMAGFLVSRAVVSGCGVVEQRGEEVFFGLSEKGPSIAHEIRPNASPSARAIFDTGNLMKPWSELAFGQWRGVWALMSGPQQRMQLGLSDSNVAQVAELLKVSATHLVLEMAEEGFLEDAPQLVDPVGALHALAQDPTLTATAPDAQGRRWTALDLQRFYWGRAQAWLKQHPAPSLQQRESARLWGEVLDALEQDPSRLIGCLDWVTKRALVENCSDEGDLFAVRKKLDLKYHELGVGYLAQLEAQGLAPRVLDEEEVERATQEPPSDSPALLRGQWIRDASPLAQDLRVTWDSGRVGGRFRGKVIRLADFRPKPPTLG